jgi:hypothetical protein
LSAIVHYKRQTEKIHAISSFSDLICKLQVVDRWRKILKYSDFVLKGQFAKDDLRIITSDDLLRGVPNDGNGVIKLVLIIKSKGFSQFKRNELEAFTAINSLVSNYAHIPRENVHFPILTFEKITVIEFNDMLDRVTDEIVHRSKVFNMVLATEYTMREFISPILIGAVRIIQNYLERERITGFLSLVCEKIVIVDYVILFDFLDIILTEAKTLDLKDGIIQNLLQLRSSQEFLANSLSSVTDVGDERKRNFDGAFEAIAKTPALGTVSNGREWVFTKLAYNEEKKSVV